MIDLSAQPFKLSNINEILLVNSFRQEIPTSIQNIRHHLLLYKLSGHVIFHINGEDMDFSPGTVCYFPPGTSYNFDRLKKGEAIHLGFETSEPTTIRAFSAKFRTCEQLGLQFQKIVSLSRSSIQSFDYRIMAETYQLLDMIVRAARSNPLSHQKQDSINAIASYLQEHLSEPDLHLSAVASQFGMSVSSFRSQFSQIFGIPPIRYLTILRLNTAKSLLINSDYSTAQIASMSGFNDQFYFSRCFKENLGISPTEYRKKHLY